VERDRRRDGFVFEIVLSYKEEMKRAKKVMFLI